MSEGFQWACRLAAVLLVAGCANKLTPSAQPVRGRGAVDVIFRDVTEESGLDFTLGHHGKSPLTILESLGQGGAFLDYDSDGYQDLLLVSDRTARLYRNDRFGEFVDVTATTGIGVPGYWHGIAVGDFDNSGTPDVCLTGYRCLKLLRNKGGRFHDVTNAMGLTPPGWGSSCAFGDLDGDGWLDLIVGEYLEFGEHSVQLCTIGDVKTACGPKIYAPRFPHVYRNRQKAFDEVTREWGFATASGKCLGIAFGDFDRDGRLDVAFANDEMPANLFLRESGQNVRFRDVGVENGLAFLGSGRVQSGMGIDCADYNADGWEDLIITNFQNEQDGLYRNQSGFFTEVSAEAHVSETTFPTVGWGVRFFDADNDGIQDLIIANGHIQDNVQITGAKSSYPQPVLLFQGGRDGRFRNLGALAGSPFATPIVGRGIAVGDYDNDGRADALVVNLEGRPLLLRNESPGPAHWIGFEAIVGRRPALGALVTIAAGEFHASRRVSTAGSIFSAQDSRVLFGLGARTEIEQVTVRWPNGREEVFDHPPSDRYTRLIAGAGKPLPEQRH